MHRKHYDTAKVNDGLHKKNIPKYRKREMTQVQQAIENNAFDKGLSTVDAISKELGKRCREELKSAFGLHSTPALRKRARGFVNHTNSDRKTIESIFTTYGAPDCWGFKN